MPRFLASVSLRPTRANSGVGEHAERHWPSGRHPMTARQIVPHNSEVIEDNVGKVWAARAIPDRPDAGGRCLKAFIHLYVATAGCLNSRQLQTNTLGVGSAASGTTTSYSSGCDLGVC